MGSISFQEVKKHNSAESAWIVINDKVYDVTTYAPAHPGGRELMLSVAGGEATDEFVAFHPSSVQEMLSCFFVGDLDTRTRPAPSPFVSDMRKLADCVRKEGLLRPSATYYVAKALVSAGILALSLFLLYKNHESTIVFSFSSFLFGLAINQLAGFNHDVTHHQVFGENRKWSTLVANIFGSALMSFSTDWWIRKHEFHHAQSNIHGFDEDIDTLPVLAWSTKVLPKDGKYSALARIILPWQSYIFVPIMTLARVSWVIQSYFWSLARVFTTPVGLCKNLPGVDDYWAPWWRSHLTELVCQTFHWVSLIVFCLDVCKMSVLELLAFLSISSSFAGIFLATIFVVNHNGMPVLDPSENVDYFTRQILSTRNIQSSLFVDWYTSGLNYQIEHHIFPGLPRHNLGTVARRVRQVCEKHGVPYKCTSYLDGFMEVFDTLDEVSRTVVDHLKKSA